MTAPDTASRELVIPGTGEVIDLTAATTTDLCEARERLTDYLTDLRAVDQAVEAELARRLDAGNERRAQVGEYELEVNPPTTTEYRLDVLRDELERLVADGVLEPQVVGKVITAPPPTTPAPRVDKREVNKLAKSQDRRVVAALAKARVVQAASRRVKIKRKDGGR